MQQQLSWQVGKNQAPQKLYYGQEDSYKWRYKAYFLNSKANQYYNKATTVKLRMKKYLKTPVKSYQTLFQTDLEDSSPIYAIKKIAEVKNKIKKSRRNLNKSGPQIYPNKILRFNLKHPKRTLRVPCFIQQQLNFPIRFTKKLNAMEVDNDVPTDEDIAEHEIQRCSQWLKQAISANKQEPSHPK